MLKITAAQEAIIPFSILSLFLQVTPEMVVTPIKRGRKVVILGSCSAPAASPLLRHLGMCEWVVLAHRCVPGVRGCMRAS